LLRKGTRREKGEGAEGRGEVRGWLVDRFRTVSFMSTGEEQEGGRLKDLAAGCFSVPKGKLLLIQLLLLPLSSELPSPPWFS
jgi:hypothetical protein